MDKQLKLSMELNNRRWTMVTVICGGCGSVDKINEGSWGHQAVQTRKVYCGNSRQYVDAKVVGEN